MRRPAPATVWIAVGAVAVVAALQIVLALLFARAGQVGWAMYAFAALLFALLLSGLVRGSRLAWLWGRSITILLGVVVSASVTWEFVRQQVGVQALALSLLGLAAPLFVAGIALGRPSAYAFYDLVCPTCGARTALGDDFLFRQARCRACKTAW
jgi:uncharacterized membrane protein